MNKQVFECTFVANDMPTVIQQRPTEPKLQSKRVLPIFKRSLIPPPPPLPIYIPLRVSLAVCINILPYQKFPLIQWPMWREKRCWQFLNYLLSVLYLLAVPWEGLGLLPHRTLPSVGRIWRHTLRLSITPFIKASTVIMPAASLLMLPAPASSTAPLHLRTDRGH